jgi:hypothetical protein
MSLWVPPLSLGRTTTLSPALSPHTPEPVGSWGQCWKTDNHPHLVLSRFIHNPQALLPLLEYHYFLEKEGKSPQ